MTESTSIGATSGDPTGASSDPDGSTGGPGYDTDGDDEGPPPELAEVSHERELRGAWIATVVNINFPSVQGLPAAAMQQELLSFINMAAAHNLNALFLQVRPEADALYASELEPWSRYLTGTQGGDPGFDPLRFFVEQAHLRGIEVHAWLNPYRAAAVYPTTFVSPHIAVTYPEHAHAYGSTLWMDPGAEQVMQHTVDVVVDIVERYDVDGIHLDDYFYPYPNGYQFPDGTTYSAYVSTGGQLARDDWRRDNVNRMVQLLHDEIVAAKPWVRFGISPFGIYRPGLPPGTTGLDQYAELYADPVKWIQEGWVDYLAPQLYWPTTQTAQAYEALVEWWVSITPEGRNLFVGNAVYQLGSSAAWTLGEIREQIELSREYQIDSPGNIFYNIASLMNDSHGVATMLATELYQQPVLPPPVWELASETVAYPKVTVDGTTVTLGSRDDTPLRGWGLYRDDGYGFEFVGLHSTAQGETLELVPGRWAITAAARSEVESMGVVIQIDG